MPSASTPSATSSRVCPELVDISSVRLRPRLRGCHRAQALPREFRDDVVAVARRGETSLSRPRPISGSPSPVWPTGCVPPTSRASNERRQGSCGERPAMSSRRRPGSRSTPGPTTPSGSGCWFGQGFLSVGCTRHTAATVLLLLQIPDRTVMGWSYTAMAARYQHIIAAIRRDVATSVADYFGSSQSRVSSGRTTMARLEHPRHRPNRSDETRTETGRRMPGCVGVDAPGHPGCSER